MVCPGLRLMRPGSAWPRVAPASAQSGWWSAVGVQGIHCTATHAQAPKKSRAGTRMSEVGGQRSWARATDRPTDRPTDPIRVAAQARVSSPPTHAIRKKALQASRPPWGKGASTTRASSSPKSKRGPSAGVDPELAEEGPGTETSRLAPDCWLGCRSACWLVSWLV